MKVVTVSFRVTSTQDGLTYIPVAVEVSSDCNFYS